ncbi:MAG: D-ribose pyranase [Melioribacteraceae bacterium]|nr:D-ribose pyranase [Melioribacteraceae bacterium]MCF8355471.1 D-ribose pyranase [Melioribacteraceae bacterium]MCF8392552.1 D-ribose pyranase [Melioribacteraceae bacterium]MCF8418433.1 D-ribose pyranase [Melioribacteraceae bacterium]
MKKIGVLNAPLSRVIASMGHTDKIVICDSGLPIPKNADVVDLALTKNIPRFLDVLRIILEELEVEKAIIAKELVEGNTVLFQEIQKLLPNKEIEEVQHENFKKLSRENGDVAFVRTGEATAFANIILISGVTFG